jgi:glycerate kinase
VRVLVAPDKFKGTLTANDAAAAIARGWRQTRPGAVIEQVPLADGGEGTLDALVAALGGQIRSAHVTGPLGARVRASFGLLPGSPPVAVVEMAQASGLALVPPDRRDPTRTTTRGTGELLLAAVRAGAGRVLVCVGGSATNDGGAGLAQALGVELLDGTDREVGPGGAALLGLERVDSSGLARELRGVSVEVLSDVDNPLTGPDGASAVFGPQKGATPDEVALLDRALVRFAGVVRRDTGVDVEGLPGAGAAGGIGASLTAFLGATFRSGLDAVMDATNLRARLAAADAVVTGEGAFDAESLRGKVVGGVIREARAAGARRVVVLCGRAEGPGPPGVDVRSLSDRFGFERAMEAGAALLEELAAETATADRVTS